MSKNKIKQNPSINPDFYQKLNIDVTNGEGLKLCLVEDMQHKWFKFDSKSNISIVSSGIRCQFDNWDAFEQNQGFTMPVLEELHKTLFGHPIPPKSNRTYAMVAIWKRWLQLAEDRLKNSQSNPVNAKKERKTSTRTYTLLTTECPIKTPQAQACIRILSDSIDKESKSITESDLKKIVYKRAADLKTKQDAWRIFQYYRPQLIATKVLKHD